MYSDTQAQQALQSRFALFLRALDTPARLCAWHVPSSLRTLIDWTVEEAAATTNPWRASILMEYRAWYEQIEKDGSFQQSLCGLELWADSDTNAGALALHAQSVLGTPVSQARWPPLLRGRYQVRRRPVWHLAPVGRPSGRPLVCLLSSYRFLSVDWTFFRPLGGLFDLGIPLGFALDIPKTWETADAVARLEGVITAMNAHLSTSIGMDSASYRQVADCTEALAEIHSGQALHDAQLKIALLADTLDELRRCVQAVKNQLRASIGLRTEVGLDQITAARYFSDQPTSRIDGSPTTWPVTSPTLALALGFLGMRKLEPRRGILRGTSHINKYPYIYDDWELSQGKKATHELWVGVTGAGKTFALNTFLARTLAHLGIPFDLLEPMGHGRLLAAAFNIQASSLSARRTRLNPHDPIATTLGDQTSHVIQLYETILGRDLKGSTRANQERGLLGEAIGSFYEGRDLPTMTPDEAPVIAEVVERLRDLGRSPASRAIASELADEIGALAVGPRSPYGFFLDGRTTIDFSIAGEDQPRIFCFHEMENDPVLIAIAYTQVLAAIMRTAMKDDHPRVIAVDEVYRMMRNPALLDVLITATKTLRTKRKKVIAIDQQMRIFTSDPKMRLVFENCPIRVIFTQKGSEDVFYHDPAFAHYTATHRHIISTQLQRFQFMMETPEGIFFLNSTPAPHEFDRFGIS